ncbi:MAG: hypothetical protein QM763_14330 [Agriterribacter sp.]
METVCEDPRIGPSHISLFMSILYCSKIRDHQTPLSVYSKELMRQAKISGMATYHKCMRDLNEMGYIRYIPSYNPVLGSQVYILNKEI